MGFTVVSLNAKERPCGALICHKPPARTFYILCFFMNRPVFGSRGGILCAGLLAFMNRPVFGLRGGSLCLVLGPWAMAGMQKQIRAMSKRIRPGLI